jgi:hypothetical protein
MKKLLIALVFCSLPLPLLAAENPSIDCGAFDKLTIADTNVYKEVHAKAVSTAKILCFSIRDIFDAGSPLAGKTPDEKYQQHLEEFGAFAAQALLRDFGGSEAIKLTDNVKEMEEQLASTNLATGRFPMFETSVTVTANKGFFSSAVRAKKFDFPTEHEDCKKVANANKSCEAVFNDYKDAFNVYRKAYDQFVDETNKQLLVSLNRQWDNFLETSKSQTALEVWLTTLWHADHFKKDHIVGPPSSQIIALHPQLVYEYLNEAVDGNNAEFGLAVEWLGINYWNKKMPFGFSVTSVYTDRLSVPDIRTGIMLHIDNRYSLGWGYRDGENSVYVSMDLLTLFQSKRQQYERYLK